MQQTVILAFFKCTQYTRPNKWWYIVCKAKIGRYAVRKGRGGVNLLYEYLTFSKTDFRTPK